MSEPGVGPERARPVMDPAETYRRQVPVSQLRSFHTPTESVYVIAHTGIAHVPIDGWELRIEGAVERPLRLTHAELLRRPAETVEGVLECFGNPVEPDVATRRVGNVSWRGTRLWPLLEEAGVQPRATLAWFEAPDHGAFAGTSSERYIKDVPLEIVRERPVLLAWELNGEPLTPEHGFPVRAVVPGFFGTNSVKWVSRIYFGMTNILSADGVTTAMAVARTWPEAQRIAVIHPDYAFGRWFQLHFEAARQKLIPKAQIVSEAWPPLGTTEFTSHITKTAAAKPDLIVTSMWGGMYIAFYKQALQHGLFSKAKLAGNINFGVVPSAIGKDHPEGALAGVHSNYHFTYPAPGRSAVNKHFVERYVQRWKEYPNYVAEAAYTGLHLFQNAVEKANKTAGGWPDDDAIIKALEGLSIAAPSGAVTVRKEDHRAFKDVKVGFSKNLAEYPFPVWDPERIITVPVQAMTAPPTWPKPGKGHDDPSATINWIKTTWPTAS